MKILFVKSFPRLTSLMPLARELRNRGHDISILLPRENPDCIEMKDAGVFVYTVDLTTAILESDNTASRLSAHIEGIRALTGFLGQYTFDIIHLNLYYARLYGRVASLFVKNGIVLSTIHGHESHYERWTNWIDNSTIAVSESVKRYLTMNGVPKDKIVVIHNGVDVGNSIKRKNQFYIHNELGLEPYIKLIGMVAYFRGHQQKGHRIFLDAAQAVLEKNSNVRFILVGSDIDRAEDKRHCEMYARTLCIEDKVFFLGEREDVKLIMDSLCVNILPSMSEGCPMVLLEAMAAGVPNIASDIGSIREIIRNGENGLLFKPGDHRALADAMLYALENPDKLKEMGTLGYETVKLSFTAQIMADRYEAIFEKSLYRRRGVH